MGLARALLLATVPLWRGSSMADENYTQLLQRRMGYLYSSHTRNTFLQNGCRSVDTCRTVVGLTILYNNIVQSWTTAEFSTTISLGIDFGCLHI